MKLLPLLSLLTFQVLYAQSFVVTAGAFNSGSEGTLQYTQENSTWNVNGTGVDTLNYLAQPQFYMAGDFEITQAYLPHLKADYIHLSTSGVSTKDVEILGADLSVNANSELEITNLDLAGYYTIFEHKNYPSFDLGLTVRYMTYNYKVSTKDTYETSGFLKTIVNLIPDYTESGYAFLPMLYSRLRYDLPFLDMTVSADSKLLMTADSTLYDNRIQADIVVEFNDVLMAVFEVGYRAQYYKLSGADSDSVETDLSYKGPYAGVGLHF